MERKEYIQVYARIRPSRDNSECVVQATSDTTIRTNTGRDVKTHQLNRVFGPSSAQDEVFESVGKRLVQGCLDGFYGTVFAYGQTGSGKTHTMIGAHSTEEFWVDPDLKGLIPRCYEYLFKCLDDKSNECEKFKYTVCVRFVELYNDTIYDLLVDNSKPQKKITLRDVYGNVDLVGATTELVSNYVDLMHVVKRGWEARRVGETAMNRDSSRSHAVLISEIITEELNGQMVLKRSATLNMVDLAGSERQSHTKSTGERLKEANHINGSLTVLGRVIRDLSSSSKNLPPFRDSHLTHILRNSLGGNSRTAVIVNMHPDKQFVSETVSTLHFASACGMIKNTVRANENMSGECEEAYKATIRQLRFEMGNIREQTRLEFVSRLEELEEHEKENREHIRSMRAENSELHTKLQCQALLRTASTDEDTTARIEKILSERVRLADEDKETLIQRVEVLAAEKMELQYRCTLIDHERASVQGKYSDLLNDTVSATPARSPSRRKSTRNPRRETIYMPSPARMSTMPMMHSLDEDSVMESSGTQQNESNGFGEQLAVLTAEKEEVQTKLDKAMSAYDELIEQMSSNERKSTLVRMELEKKIEELKDELRAERNARLEEEARNKRAEDQLGRLLLDVRSYKEAKRCAEEERDEMRRRYYEMDERCSELEKEKAAEIEMRELEKEGKIGELETYFSQQLQLKEESALDMEHDWRQKEKKWQEEFDEVSAELQNSKDSVEKCSLELQQTKTLYENAVREMEEQKDEHVRSTNAIVAQKNETISGLEMAVEKKGLELREAVSEITDLRNKLTSMSADEERLVKAEGRVESLQRELKMTQATLERRTIELKTDVDGVKRRMTDDVNKANTLLESERAAHARTRETLLQNNDNANDKFRRKMDDLQKRFRDEKADEIAGAVAEVRSEHAHEVDRLKARHSTTVAKLEARIADLQQQHDEDTESLKSAAGHMNKQQKVSYVESLRDKNAQLAAELAKLREELAAKNKSETAPPRRALRSNRHNVPQ